LRLAYSYAANDNERGSGVEDSANRGVAFNAPAPLYLCAGYFREASEEREILRRGTFSSIEVYDVNA
jgi:hypothetical protein